MTDDFWEWLPKAYGDVGDEPTFTKYNMEVAFAAGAEAEAKRMWVGLTDEEMKALHRNAGVTYLVPADYDRHLFTHMTDAQLMKISRAIEAKLKEKNA